MPTENLSLIKLIEMREKGKASPEEIATWYLNRIKRYDGFLNAFICINNELEEEAKMGKFAQQGLLAGVPVAVKDNINTKKLPTTCSSGAVRYDIEKYNAAAVYELLKAGCLLAGKTNMHEFGMVAPAEDNSFKTTRNPRNPAYLPGGSSSGSAAAVAAGMVPAALGSDTGGSIRIPAAHCGVVGLKPTYGLVSRCGLIAFAPSLDQIGPITTRVEDAALMLDILAREDIRYRSSVSAKNISFANLGEDNIQEKVKNLRIGVITNCLEHKLVAPKIRKKVENALKILYNQGIQLSKVELPLIEKAKAAYYIIAHAELYDILTANHRDELNICLEEDSMTSRLNPEKTWRLGDEVKRRLLLGSFVHKNKFYYKKACRLRTLLIKELSRILQKLDIIITPTTPRLPQKHGTEKTKSASYNLPNFTMPANLSGMPALSLPVGFTSENLPIGIHLMADYFQEEKLLQTAYLLEQELSLPQQVSNKDLAFRSEGKN